MLEEVNQGRQYVALPIDALEGVAVEEAQLPFVLAQTDIEGTYAGLQLCRYIDGLCSINII